jgi:outer membrane protein OmpA-like peptidoglycan-associated protein
MPNITVKRDNYRARSALAYPLEGIARAAQPFGLSPGAMCWLLLTLTLFGLMSTPTHAFDLTLPEGAQQSYAEVIDPDTYEVPLGPWQDSLPTRRIEGRVERLAFKLASGDVTVLQTLKPMRAQLELQGYEILFECADKECGGFDFRFATEVLSAPDMYVNLSDFLYLVAHDAEAGRWATLLVSRNAQARYIQLIRVTSSLDTGVVLSSSSRVGALVLPSEDLGLRLIDWGHAVLEDLTFASGAADLAIGPFDSLANLASFLQSDPTRRIVLVGHTDAVGSLDTNMTLSQRRAAAVRNRLIERHNVDASQLQAEGLGYLAPRASNLTETGRVTNRRVEAILLP